MRKYIFMIVIVFLYQFIKAQEKSKAVVLYENGNVAFAKKDYRTADSLFTLSLNLEPHPDSYYNRAVCKRQLKDFKNYCLDMKSASILGDREASSLYNKQCKVSDTIYKYSNGEAANKNDYAIVEYITSYKYNTNYEYEKLDTAKRIILSKIREDNIVIYKACSEVINPSYFGGVDSLIKKIKTETDFTNQVLKNDLASFSELTFQIDENGKTNGVIVT